MGAVPQHVVKAPQGKSDFLCVEVTFLENLLYRTLQDFCWHPLCLNCVMKNLNFGFFHSKNLSFREVCEEGSY